MWTRTARWFVAALIASAVSAVGCARPEAPAGERARVVRVPIAADQSVAHAFDTEMEMRVLDRLQLDNFLRDRDIRIRVIDGTVNISGEVWTPLEKERASTLLRHVPGVIHVANDLAIRPPD